MARQKKRHAKKKHNPHKNGYQLRGVQFRVYDHKAQLFMNNGVYPNPELMPMVSDLGELSVWNDYQDCWIEDVSRFSVEFYGSLK